MPALVTEVYSDPYFNIETAASPQRSRPDSIERTLRRLSQKSLRNDIDSLLTLTDNSWLDEPKYVRKSLSTTSLPIITEKSLIEKSYIEMNGTEIQNKKKKRFSIFKTYSNKVASEAPIKLEEKKLQKRSSFLGSLRKLFGHKAKMDSEKGGRIKAKNLFDDDDGILDESDISLTLSLNDGGMPFDLANSTLRTTYMHSLQKLQYKEQRPLVQLMLIHTVVNRLQDHVKSTGAILPVNWLPPTKTVYARRRSLPNNLNINKRLTSRSESDLSSQTKTIFNVQRAARSQDFFPEFSTNNEGLNSVYHEV